MIPPQVEKRITIRGGDGKVPMRRGEESIPIPRGEGSHPRRRGKGPVKNSVFPCQEVNVSCYEEA